MRHGGSVRLSDLSVTLLCGSDDDHTPVNSDQVLPDVDLLPESVSNDKRQVIMPLPLCIPATTTSGRDLDVTPGSSGPDPPPVVGTVAIPAVENVEAVKLSSPPLSGQLSVVRGLVGALVHQSCSGGTLTGRSG